ncbi:hypothetical protein CapIbe_019995 [Capra ibex]
MLKLTFTRCINYSNITPNPCFLLLSLDICDEEMELGRCWRKDTDLQLEDEYLLELCRQHGDYRMDRSSRI